MSRRTERTWCWALAGLGWLLAGSAGAQTPAAPDVGGEASEAYLADRGLYEVLAARLRQRLNNGQAEERVRAAELLGKLYVRMLSEAT
jgi:hypothetical protein